MNHLFICKIYQICPKIIGKQSEKLPYGHSRIEIVLFKVFLFTNHPGSSIETLQASIYLNRLIICFSCIFFFLQSNCQIEPLVL